MNGWSVEALGNIATIERSTLQPQQIRAGTSYVGLEHIGNGGSFINPQRIEAGDLASSKFRFTEQHVLYGKLRPYLAKIACPDFAGVCSTDILPILPGPRIDRRYLLHYLRQPRIVEYASSQAVGVNLPRLNPSVLSSIQVPLPPLPEQRRIADTLDRAEALRGKRRASVAQLDALVESLFLDFFGHPATNQRGWPRRQLYEMTHKLTDGEHLNPQFSRAGMPIVMAGNVGEERIDFDTCKFVNESLGLHFRRKCDPLLGDLLVVSRGATIGQTCTVADNRSFCLMGSVILVRPNTELLEPKFLQIYLKHPTTRAALVNTSGSTAQQAIYLKDMKRLTCFVPPLSLQREFARRICVIDALKMIQRESLLSMDRLFASLQHRAFQGEL